MEGHTKQLLGNARISSILIFNKQMKPHMFEKTSLQYGVYNGKTLTGLERQIYNGEKPICGH